MEKESDMKSVDWAMRTGMVMGMVVLSSACTPLVTIGPPPTPEPSPRPTLAAIAAIATALPSPTIVTPTITPPVPTPTSAPTPAATSTPAAAAGVDCTVDTPSLRLRAGPGTTFVIKGGVTGGQVITATARNTDGTWLQVQVDEAQEGWVAAQLVDCGQNAGGLPEAEDTGTGNSAIDE
jgi:hypothetical protein